MQNYQLKDSGIDVLGDIPTHWTLGKIKNHFFLKPSNVDKKSHDDEISVQLCNYVDVYYNDFIVNDLDFMGATAKQSEIDKFSLQIDDVIITKDSEDPMDIGVPALVKENKPNLLCGYHLTMLKKRLSNTSGAFLFWLLKDNAIASQLYREATGVTRWAISSRNIKNVSVAYPSFDEQKVIANYLDKACKKIDKTISIKQQQLEKLEAYRKSVIHEAVTKGLDKNIAMKNSGVEWLGDIPEHWKTNKLKRHAKFKNGVNFSASERGLGTLTLDVLNMYGGISSSFDKCYRVNNQNNDDYLLKKGDILFVRSSVKRVGVGWCSMFTNHPEPVQYCGFIIRARLFTNILSPKFTTYFLQSHLGREQIILRSTTVTITNIRQDNLGSIFIAFPNKPEQKSITEYLDKACEKFNTSKLTIENQIKKLTQYRQSLIHECVTGKKRIYQGEIN